jgi:PQQ-like domain
MPADNNTVSGLARLLLLVPLVLVAPLGAADWPQWRGPSSGGVSPESALPVTWSATENIAWKARLSGHGTSSPIVSGDTVFVTSQVGRSTLAEGNTHPQLARDDGELAKREAPIGGRRGNANAGEGDVLARNDLGERLIASPAISGGRIFLRSDGTLFAVGK